MQEHIRVWKSVQGKMLDENIQRSKNFWDCPLSCSYILIEVSIEDKMVLFCSIIIINLSEYSLTKKYAQLTKLFFNFHSDYSQTLLRCRNFEEEDTLRRISKTSICFWKSRIVPFELEELLFKNFFLLRE